MTTLAEELAADQRIIILRSLQEASAAQLNETIVRLMVNKFGHGVGRDAVRQELAWLAERRLVRIEKIQTGESEFWVAHLLSSGDDVAGGRVIVPGISRRLAE